MEVTKANFADLLPVIERSINECIFMSMDTEFTGTPPSMFKNTQQIFRLTPNSYRIILGVCT